MIGSSYHVGVVERLRGCGWMGRHLINSNPGEDQPIDISAIPQVLSQFMAVNVEHNVLICTGSECSRPVRSAGFLEHVRKKEHSITKAGRK